MKTVLLYSGGLDSTTARYFLKPDLMVYVDLGVEYSDKEIAALPEGVEVLSLRGAVAEVGYTGHVTPYRNMLFAMLAYNAACKRWPKEDCITVAVAGVAEDLGVEDKNPQAFQIMTASLNAIRPKGTPLINVWSPFWKMTKKDLVLWLRTHEENWHDILRGIVTCYEGGAGRCGKCWACSAFFVTLTRAGVSARDWFEHDVVAKTEEYARDKAGVFISPMWLAEIEESLRAVARLK